MTAPVTGITSPVALPVRTETAQTWAGRSSQSIGGYVARSVATHVGSALILRKPAASRYAPSSARLEEALQRFEYQAYHPNPDADERKVAFKQEHGPRLLWTLDHLRSTLELVTAPTRTFYNHLADEVVEINLQYRALLDEQDALLKNTSTLEPHEQNVRINDEELRIDAEIDQLAKKIYEIERSWQTSFYGDLIQQARETGRLSKKQEKQFLTTLDAFEKASLAELRYRDRLIAKDKDTTPNKRKGLEEAAYRLLMHGSTSLHEVTRRILRKVGETATADALTAPLTFVWKNQMYRHSQGPVDFVAGERFIESMIGLRPEVRATQKGLRSSREFDKTVSPHWGIPVLGDFFERFRIGAPPGLFSLDHMPAEARSLAGALTVFGEGSPLLGTQGGVVSDQTHGDSIDYAAVYASRHLLWGNQKRPVSIVAESAFRHIPIMGAVMMITTGGFLSRSDAAKRAVFMDEILPARLSEGNDVALFGEGTRPLSNPFAARYSDLDNPAALHNPAEFLTPGPMRGMQFDLALANQTDVQLYASKVHGGGSGEPSIPRTRKGFLGANETEFSFRPPLPENGFVAFAGVITYLDMIKPKDFSGEPDYKIRLRNVAVNRRMLRRTGLNMDAGPELR